MPPSALICTDGKCERNEGTDQEWAGLRDTAGAVRLQACRVSWDAAVSPGHVMAAWEVTGICPLSPERVCCRMDEGIASPERVAEPDVSIVLAKRDAWMTRTR